MITTETTTIYRATFGGASKRFLSRHSAAHWLAKQLIKKHCYCDFGDEVMPGNTCHYHMSERIASKRIVKRLTRFIVYGSIHPAEATT